MKRNLFFVLLVILSISFMGNLFAQTSVTIGNGTASQRQPMSPYWGHERSAALYTFAEIGGVGTIESIGWNVANSKTTDVPYKIYLGTTADTQLTSQTFDSLTQNMILVDEGNYAFDSLGWHTITLSNPFTYTGGNLVVAVETNYGGSGAGYGNYAEFYYTTATNAHMYWNADSNPPAGNGNVNSYRPNLMLSLGELTGDPELSVNPDTDYEFPLTMINTTAQKEFSVANIGGGNINITGFSVSGDGFALADAFTPVTLGSGNMHNFTVEYTPTVAGNHTATLLIETSAGNHSAQLSGSCFDPTIRELPYTENFDSVATTSLPLGWTVLNPDNPNVTWQTSTTNPNSSPNCVRIGYTYSGDGPLNDWFITPPVEMEAGVEYRISYHYRAGSASYYEKLALRVGNAPTAAAMTETLIDHDGFNHATYDLVRTMFTPTADGNYFFGWHAYSAENLLAIYVDDITIELAPTTPLITLQNDDINFGSMRENTISDYQNLIIRNVGSGMLTVDMSNVSLVGSDTDQFEIDYSVLPLNIAAEESANLPIRFVPNNAGFKSATIQIVNSATSDVHEATLSGLAVGENDLFESFEATTFPPAGWANPGSWSRSTSYKVDGDASAYKYGNTSTQFILRTPMLDVNAGDVFNFWSLASTLAGKLQLVYSEDESTWTQIGADLEHAATYTWYNHTVDISSLAGGSYYFGIRTGLQAASFYVDLVAGPEPMPMLPGTPTLSAPANASINQNEMPELRWTVPTSGGVAFGYNIYLDTDPNPTTLIAESNTNSLHVASPLDWNTTYYWKVAAYNNTGEGVASDIYSFTVKEDSTIRTFPFVEGFEDGYTQGQAVAGHWTQITGPEFTSRRWTANRTETGYNRTPRTGSWNAYMQWSGESTLVRPIALEGGKNYKLELYARQDGAVAANAKIKASYGLSGTLANLNESIIEETGIVNGDYQQLEGYFSPADDGIYYIGITGWINGSPYYLSIDDIKIIEISDDPVLSYSPESIDFGDAVFGATVGPRNITIVNDGGGTLNLEVTDIEITGTNADLFSFDDSVFPVSLGTGITASIPVFVTGTAEGSASATLIINYDGVGHEVALSANILPDGLVLIGDGTADNKMPVNPWYGYSYAQMLYNADEILTQGRQIEKVAYHWNGVNIGINSDQWTIYMGHTDKEAFDSTTDWIDINELTEVFQGDVAILAEDTWIEIMLQIPFVYNGTDNLVIAVHETRPGNDGNTAFFYNTPSTTGRSLRCHSDSANPEPAAPPTGTLTAAYPNIRMYFGDVPDEPVLSITPDSWDAGEIKINTQASQQFTIRNIGGGTLVVNELEVSGDYFTLAAPFTGASLETAESVQFTVNFDPLATGDYQGSITVDTSVGVENIDLEGSCFDPTIYEFPHTEDFDGEWTGSPAAPAGWTVINANNDSYTWRQSSQYISPTHSAPYAANGTGNTDDYLITPPIMMPANNLRLKWWDKVEGANYPNKYKILISTTDTEITSFTEELLDVTCTNTAWTEKSVDINAATYNGTIFVAFYQYASTSAVWGFGIDDFSIEELSSTPIFAADQDSYDFGETMINTTDSKSIMVGNIGGGELVITEIEISGDDAFALGTLPTLPAILERDEFINFDAIFAPTAAGDHNATITITDNQNTRYTINAGSLRSGNSRSRDDHTVTLTGSCFDPTIYDFPYLEDFGTTTADWPPTEWTQRNGLYPNASGTTSQWVRGNWLNGASGNNAAKINIYGTVRNGWLITRPIHIQSENFELKFDLGLTKWNSSDPINSIEGQPDDRFMVVVSDSPDMANPSILREWNNDDSELVFNHIPHTGIPVSIPLTGITGTKYFAFYAESTISNGDNDLFVDNVLIREIPDNPIFVINPESHDFDDIMVNTSASQVFTIINNGGGALIIDSIEIDGDGAFSLDNLPELPATLGAGDAVAFDAMFAPTEAGDYNATITITDNLNNRYSVNAGSRRSSNTHSRAANTVTLTGSCLDPTIRTLPYAENFDSVTTPNMPLGWTVLNPDNPTVLWQTSTTFSNSPSNSVHVGYTSSSAGPLDDWFITPPVVMEAGVEYNIGYYYRARGNYPEDLALKVGTSPTAEGLTQTLTEHVGFTYTSFQEVNVTFTPDADGSYFFGWHAFSDANQFGIYVDDITIDYNYIVTPNDHADVGGDTTASVTGDGFVGAIEVPMAPENLTPIPNPSFVVINHQVWQLIGTGEINLRFDNNGIDDIWFSHVVGGTWMPQEIPAGGYINVTVDLGAKDASLEFALGTGGNPTLPVELSYFNAVFMLNENSVKLSWKTESETQMLGYQIYRSMDTELANAILITPQIVTASNSSTGDSYSYLDKEVESGTYYYWLEAVSYNSSDYYGYQTVVIDIPSAPELPEISSMGNAYPNPFKNATSIDIAIKGGETGSFTIYNMLGQAVYREKLSEGNVTIQWHGKDNNGNRCGSGVYFYKLITPTKSQTKKMVIMK